MKKIIFLLAFIAINLTILPAQQQSEDPVWVIYSEHASTARPGLKQLPRLTYASESIETEGEVNISAGSEATFRTSPEGLINLMGHFKVEKGAYFLAHKAAPDQPKADPEPELQARESFIPKVNAQPSVITMRMHPNPFTDYLTIDLVLETQSQVQIRIYDATGRLMNEVIREEQMTAGRHRTQVNTSNFVPGMYFCEVITDSQQFRETIVCVE